MNLKLTTKNFTKTKLGKKKNILKDENLCEEEKKVKLEFKPEIVDKDIVEFVRKVPLQPCERLRQKFK